MRPWRKLHSSILESERFMDVPIESKLLFMLLVAAQDDTGYFPWERMKVRRLVATCRWTETQAKKYADALVTGELATWEEGGLILRNGEELNGNPRDDRKPFLYQRQADDGQLATSDSQGPAKETDDRERIKRKNKEKEAPVAQLVLPDWIQQESWDDYLEMRRKKRAPATDRAQFLIIGELGKLMKLGDDPNEILKNSIINNWTGVFPLKVERGNKSVVKSDPSNGKIDAKEYIRRHGLPTPKEAQYE